MVWALPIWTLLIWTTRIRNILGDEGHSRVELLVPSVLTALAVLALVERRRGTRILAVATVGIWAVRLPLVLARDHGAAFKLVHALLALVSIGLAVAAWRASARRSTISADR